MSDYRLGDEAIAHAAKYGVDLDENQQKYVRGTFAVNESDGQYSNSLTCDCQPRRNGKGESLQTIGAYGAHKLGEHTLHSAHRLDTSEDAFRRIDELAAHPYLQSIYAPTYSNGKQSYRLGDFGGGVSFRARGDKAGRGLSDIDRVIYDEAQILYRSAMAAASPTTLTAKFGQTCLAGSAGVGSQAGENPESSAVWWDYRRAGILHNAGLVESPGLFWNESTAETWTINPETFDIEFHTPDPHDRTNWYLANPALRAGRITEARLVNMMTQLGESLFLRECLNVWDPPPNRGVRNSKLSPEAWASAVDVESSVATGLVLAVDADWDAASAVIYVAGRRSDGTRHVGIAAAAPGISWVETRLKALIQELEADQKRPLKIGYDSTGPAKVLEPILKKATAGPIDLVALAGGAYSAACVGFANGVGVGDIKHRGDIETTSAVNAARVRRYGQQDSWIWHSADHQNISPLRCATVAAWTAELVPVRLSAYEDAMS